MDNKKSPNISETHARKTEHIEGWEFNGRSTFPKKKPKKAEKNHKDNEKK